MFQRLLHDATRAATIFNTVDEVRKLLDEHAQPGANPYIPSHLWGGTHKMWTEQGEVEVQERTREDFLQEITRGEAVLSLEGSHPVSFVRDVGCTITMRVTCQVDPKPAAPTFLQAYKRQRDGSEKMRKHRHSSISEKLVMSELDGLGVDLTDSLIEWWEDVCRTYQARTIEPCLHRHLLNIIRRLIWEELRIDVSDGDIGFDRIMFVPVRLWALQDPILVRLMNQGVYESDSYPGLWTRNRLLCFYWNMPKFFVSRAQIVPSLRLQ